MSAVHWKCKCGWKYTSPIPVEGVSHECRPDPLAPPKITHLKVDKDREESAA